MKTIVLVNPPNHGVDRYNLAPPLGLMVLARLAKRCGYLPKIVDFDLPRYRARAAQPDSFYEFSAGEILQHHPCLVGFTSMGVNAHVSLLIGAQLNKMAPTVEQIFGGPFFSSISGEFTKVAPWAKKVLRGEAENEFCALLGAKRTETGSIEHPFEAYDAISLNEYFGENPRHLINYEGGRGCIFKCAFCYSPGHYIKTRSLKPDQIVSELEKLVSFGTRHVFFVNDNFLNFPKEAGEICDALVAAHLLLTWNCYATLPQLRPEIIRKLSAAKCSSVYLGIDAVEATQQKVFNKRFLKDFSFMDQVVKTAVEAGISPTCAFIFDVEEWNPASVAAIFRVAARCATLGAKIRFNVLTPYPGSGLSSQWKSRSYSESRIGIMLDCPKVVKTNPLAAQFPEIFPFHMRPIGEDLWRKRLRTVWLAQRLIQQYAKDFCVLASRSDTELVNLFIELANKESYKEENRYETA